MQRREFLATAAIIGSAAPIIGLPRFAAATTAATRVSGPFTHENLAIYFAHGPSSPGPAPLTLQEALSRGKVIVHETGEVNRLMIENRGDEEVFVQAGDIVKGGQQDRVLTISIVLPKNSRPMPIGAYCVEQGRWEKRGKEDAKRFSSSDTAVPSRKAKIAMKAPANSDSPIRSETGQRQNEMWRDVTETQNKLAKTLGGAIVAPESRSSLQLSLENERVRATVADYVKALKPLLERAPDAIGFAFAVNGKINSADLYPSHALFAKLWPKLLDAAVTEALAEKNGAAGRAPTVEQVMAFLDDAERGGGERAKTTERAVDADNRVATRESDKTYYFETRRPTGESVHRNYLAR